MTVEKVEGAKYVMVDNSTYIGENYAVGTVITLINDDGTEMPLFTDADGNKKYVRMRDVVKLVGDAEPKGVQKLQFTELQKDTVYVEPDGDYVMIASKPVAGETLFVQRNFFEEPFIADYYNEGDVHSDGYTQATEEAVQEFNELFKQHVLENQQHITEEELEGLEEGDKITLVDYLYEGHDFDVYCNVAMLTNAGEELTVSTHNRLGNVLVRETAYSYSYDMIASVKKTVNQEKPKFAVGDLVTTDGVLGTADWDIARRVTAVNMETRKYEMEWADGVVAEINSPISFTEADACLTHYTGKVPTEETAKLEAAEKEHGYVPPLVNEVGTVIEAGKYYAMGHVMIRVDSVSGDIFTGTCVTKSYGVIPDLCIHIGSGYVRSAVPATEAQIAVFDAAVALHEAQKAFREVA